MSIGFIIGPTTLPNGTELYMTTEDDQTITAGDGNVLVADFGQGGTITVGNGDSDLFATRGSETITAGTGDFVVLTGVNSHVTIGSNSGAGGDQSVIAADKGSTVNVADGKNVVFMNGTTEQVTTGTGTDVVFALGSGSNTVSFGNGMNWAFLHDYNNIVNDGTGTDTVWMGAGASKIVPNAGDGNDFVFNFNDSDQIDLTRALAGLNVSLAAASLAPYVTVTQSPDKNFPALTDTLVTIKGLSSTADVELTNYNAGGLQGLLNHNVLALAGTIAL